MTFTPGVAVATVTPTGNKGYVTINYDDASHCDIQILFGPFPGTLSGQQHICSAPAGQTTSISTDGEPGGTWSSANTNVITINASTGLVTAVSAGSTYVVYEAPSCGPGAYSTVYPIFVDAPATATIAGPAIVSICRMGSTTLNATPSGGNWISSSPSVASVSGTGVVSGGMLGGTATITYAFNNGCGTTTDTRTIKVDPFPGNITGNPNICVGVPNSTTLSTNGTPGGVWSCNPPTVATVNTATGVVTGVGPGYADVMYTVGSGSACGPASSTTFHMQIDDASATIATLAADYCTGSTNTLIGFSPGGTWTSSNTGVATIDLNTGDVTGVGAGTSTIVYTAPVNACGGGPYSDNAVITYTAPPNPGTVTYTASVVCQDDVITYGISGGVGGGTWSSDYTTVATIGTATGDITGHVGGTAMISYTVNNVCGDFAATETVSVTALAIPGNITGTNALCNGGATTMLTDASGDAGGIWSSTNTSVATVGTAGGITTGAAGTTTISYTVVNTCPAQAATYVVTVDPTPNAGTITGPATVCDAWYMSLSDATGDAGGEWSSSSTAIATINYIGDVAGVAPGTATMSYTVTNHCPSVTATYTITVNPLPATPAAINGTPALCVSASYTFTDATVGGVWGSTNTSVAAVGTSGLVTGVATGTATITYVYTNICASAPVTYDVTVEQTPNIQAIVGPATVCFGGDCVMSDGTGDTWGHWSSSNTAVADIQTLGGSLAAGIVGTATITYDLTNSCASVNRTTTITVIPLANPGSITGATTVCYGGTTALTNATGGGTWSNNAIAATVGSATGIVTGVGCCVTTITYTVSNSCGPQHALHAMTVNQLPNAGTITGKACASNTSTLSDNGNAGGTWNSVNTSIATIGSSTGIATGVVAGTSTISYTVTNSCATATATYVLTVDALPTISGTPHVCEPANYGPQFTTLTANSAYGDWTISNTAIADIGGGGVTYVDMQGISPGTATISFTLWGGGCATHTATVAFTVVAAGTPGNVTGTPIVSGDISFGPVSSPSANGSLTYNVGGGSAVSSVDWGIGTPFSLRGGSTNASNPVLISYSTSQSGWLTWPVEITYSASGCKDVVYTPIIYLW